MFIKNRNRIITNYCIHFINKSILVQVMAWCHQTSQYLNHCWPRALSPYDIIRHYELMNQWFSQVNLEESISGILWLLNIREYGLGSSWMASYVPISCFLWSDILAHINNYFFVLYRACQTHQSWCHVTHQTDRWAFKCLIHWPLKELGNKTTKKPWKFSLHGGWPFLLQIQMVICGFPT